MLLALVGVAVVAGFWGTFLSPKATVKLSKPRRLVLELAVWLLAGAALAAVGRVWLGAAFVVVAAVSGWLNYRLS